MYAIKSKDGNLLAKATTTGIDGRVTGPILVEGPEKARKFWWEWTAKSAAKKAAALLGTELEVVDLDPSPEPEPPPDPVKAGICRVDTILVVPPETGVDPSFFVVSGRIPPDASCRFQVTFRRFEVGKDATGKKTLDRTDDVQSVALPLEWVRDFHSLAKLTLASWGWVLFYPDVTSYSENHLSAVWNGMVDAFLAHEAHEFRLKESDAECLKAINKK